MSGIIPDEMMAALKDHEGEALASIRDAVQHLQDLPWIDWDELPPSLAGLEPEEIHRRFMIGREPFPDLAAAEHVRGRMQDMLVSWAQSLALAGKALSDDTKALESRKRAENRRRAVIARIAKDDLSTPAELARQVNAMLLANPELVKKYDFAQPVPHQRGKRKPKVIMDLIVTIKNMKRAVPPTLTQADRDELDRDLMILDFEDLDRHLTV